MFSLPSALFSPSILYSLSLSHSLFPLFCLRPSLPPLLLLIAFLAFKHFCVSFHHICNVSVSLSLLSHITRSLSFLSLSHLISLFYFFSSLTRYMFSLPPLHVRTQTHQCTHPFLSFSVHLIWISTSPLPNLLGGTQLSREKRGAKPKAEPLYPDHIHTHTHTVIFLHHQICDLCMSATILPA